MFLTSPYVSLDPSPDVRKGLLSRRTFRAFEKRSVSPSLRQSLLETARWTLGSGDSEPVRFIVLDDVIVKRDLFKLRRESDQTSDILELICSFLSTARVSESHV